MKKIFLLSICIAGLLLSFSDGYCDESTLQISGVVKKVEFLMVSWAGEGKKTVIRFNDGRVKVFSGVSHETFQEGKMNIISYRNYEILSVKIK